MVYAGHMQRDPQTGRVVSTAPQDTESTRYCPECDAYRPKGEFYADKRTSAGLTRRCRTHHSRKSYESRRGTAKSSERNHRSGRPSHLRRRYGMTVEEYHELWEAQGGVCAICRTVPVVEFPPVDHCHATNIVRGILCPDCNVGLGYFKDDPALLRAAADYLELDRPDARPIARRRVVTQREHVARIANTAGVSFHQAWRTLKKPGDPVALDVRRRVWAAYESLRPEVHGLRVVRHVS